MAIRKVTIGVIGVSNLLTKSPDPPSTSRASFACLTSSTFCSSLVEKVM